MPDLCSSLRRKDGSFLAAVPLPATELAAPLFPRWARKGLAFKREPKIATLMVLAFSCDAPLATGWLALVETLRLRELNLEFLSMAAP